MNYELSLWQDYQTPDKLRQDLKNKYKNIGLEDTALEKFSAVASPFDFDSTHIYMLYNNKATDKITEESNYNQNQWIYPVYYKNKQLKDLVKEYEKTIETLTEQTLDNFENYINNLDTIDIDKYNLIQSLKRDINNKYDYFFLTELGDNLKVSDINNNIRIINTNFIEEKVCILANNNQEYFKGKIYNIHYIPNINGTSQITFEVPKKYRDLLSGKTIDNDYLDLIHLKSKLKLKFKDKWFSFIVNEKEEKKSSKGIYYSFSANSLEIEELSKIGYTIVLSNDETIIETCGAGTAAELATKILKDSDWEYSEELTDACFTEFEEKTEFNYKTGLYESKRYPVISYNKVFSPFYKEYVTATPYYLPYNTNGKIAGMQDFLKFKPKYLVEKESKNIDGYRIYTRDNLNISTNGTTENLVTNHNNFSQMDDWDNESTKGVYFPNRINGITYLCVPKTLSVSTSNFLTKTLSKGNYLFSIKTRGEEKDKKNFDFSIGNNRGNQIDFKNAQSNTLYVFNLQSTLSQPKVTIAAQNELLEIEEVTLIKFELCNSETKESVLVTPDIALITNTPRVLDKDDLNKKGYFYLEPDTSISAKSTIEREFFIQPFKDEIEGEEILGEKYDDLKSYIISIDKELILNQLSNKVNRLTNAGARLVELNNINDSFESLNSTYINEDKKINDIIKMTDKYGNITYFICEEIFYNENSSLVWRDLEYYELLEKIRIVTGEKSNRFSLLQEIAESFKVYVGFKVYYNYETGEMLYNKGKPIKKVYFTDRIGKKHYSGFKEGINLSDLSRKNVSTDLVTKMYVENIESDYTSDGLVAIQLSNLSPNKENYIYNFRHYLNTRQLNDNFINELKELNSNVKALNTKYLALMSEISILKESLSNNQSTMKGLQTSETEIKNQIAEIKAEYLRYGYKGYVYENSDGRFEEYTLNDIAKKLGITPYYYDGDGTKPLENSRKGTKRVNNIIIFDNQDIELDSEIDKKEDYYLIGDWDWLVNDGNWHVFNIDTDMKLSVDEARREVLNAYKELYKEDPKRPSGWVFEDKTQNFYYIDNYNDEYDKNVNIFKKIIIRFISDIYFCPKKIIDNLIQFKFKETDRFLEASGYKTKATFVAKIKTQLQLESELKIIQKNIEDLQPIIDKEIEDLNNKLELCNNYLTSKSRMITNFESKYSQFIKEGYWSGNKQYTDNNSYYLDALSISNDSSIPRAEYNISIVDLSSIDYYKELTFEVGDETFGIDKDIFGVDDNGQPIRERIIITEINYQLDDDSKNTITVKNYTNRFEDLFSKITAAVTSVQNNEFTWDRASILNSDGTINSNVLNDINMENLSLYNTANGVLNSYILDNTGLTLTSQINPRNQLRATSMGIFLTENGGTIWSSAISASGINASLIKSGTLKTSNITILSEYSPSQTWDGLGITSYRFSGNEGDNISGIQGVRNNNFVRLDKFGLYLFDKRKIENQNKEAADSGDFGLDSNGVPWFYKLSEEVAKNQIINNARTGITLDGFFYNTNPGNNDSFIKIGQFTDEEGLKTEGIWFKDNKKTLFRIDNGTEKRKYIAQFAGWNFTDNSLYVNKNNIGEAYRTENSFYISATTGLAMKNISLKTSGLATFGNINLTGGKINGDVRISSAAIGPFLIKADEINPTSKNNYLYSEVGTNYNKIFNMNPWTSDIEHLLGRDNKFYLGNAILTKNSLNRYGFTNEQQKHLTDRNKNGVLLSLGDDIWFHTAGFCYVGTNARFTGTLDVENLNVNKLNIEGVGDIASWVQDNPNQIIETVNRGVSTGQINLGPQLPNSSESLQLSISEDNLLAWTWNSYTNSSIQMDFSSLPCIKFETSGINGTTYLIVHRRPRPLNTTTIYFVYKDDYSVWQARDLI